MICIHSFNSVFSFMRSSLSGELDFGEMRNSPDEGWTAAV